MDDVAIKPVERGAARRRAGAKAQPGGRVEVVPESLTCGVSFPPNAVSPEAPRRARVASGSEVKLTRWVVADLETRSNESLLLQADRAERRGSREPHRVRSHCVKCGKSSRSMRGTRRASRLPMTPLNAPGHVPFLAASERPTLIEGLRPCSASPNDSAARSGQKVADGRTFLGARCTSCGERASDWRQMLGLGAHVAECAGDANQARLEYPHACNRCGASEVVVSAA